MLYHQVGSSVEPTFAKPNWEGKAVDATEVTPRIFSIGPHFTYILDHQKGEIIQVSESFIDILGYDAKVLLETGVDFFYQITHVEDKNQMIRDNEIAWRLARRLNPETRKKVRMSSYCRFKRKDGSYLNALTQTNVIQTDENGNIILTLNVCTDMQGWQREDGQSFSVDLQEGCDSFVRLTEEQEAPEIFSKREREILRLLVAGYNSKIISDKLSISYHTVNTHRKNMLRKINFKNTSELIGYVITNGLI